MPAWIWPENAPDTNAYVRFEDGFTLNAAEDVVARVSVSGEYALFINGALAGFGQYADWPERRAVNAHDITPFCHAGRNEFLLAAWHQSLDCSVDVACPARAWFTVDASGRTLLESAMATPCRVDARYRQGPMWVITGQLGYGFEYDATAPLPPLGRAAAVEAPAVTYPRPLRQLLMEPLREGVCCARGSYREKEVSALPALRMRLAELTLHAPEASADFRAEEGDGVCLIFDLGEETAGFFHLEADFDGDCEVLIGYGEHLADGRVRTEIDGRSFCARYHAAPGCNVFTHRFRRWGCRYLQIHAAAKQVRIRKIGLLPVTYPTDDTPRFRCDEALHSRICAVGRRTLKNCMHSHYEDTPWREQALYAMDGRLQMLSGYYAFGEGDMPRESLRLLAGGQRADGLLELCAPARVAVTIPSFSLHFVQAVWEYVLHTGDRAFAAEMTPVILRILSAFANQSDGRGRLQCFTGVGYWNFFEWREGLDGGEIFPKAEHKPRLEGLLTAHYALALEAAQQLLALNGGDTADLEERRRRAVQGVRTFRNGETGLYAAYIEGDEKHTDAALMQAMALLCGASRGDEAARLRAKLAANEGLIPVTLSCALMRYQALLQDEAAYADLVFEEIGRIWGGMLAKGATSFWETEKGEADFHHAGSLCHAWSAIPVYFYYAYAWGVRPDAPGVWRMHPTAQTVIDGAGGLK